MPKPRNKKRPFIDKRNERTTTFALLHRSQKDPLAADSDAPQMVLHQHPDVIKRKEEEREHGVFFEDDYDYLQHLKDRQNEEKDWDEVDKFLINAPEERKSVPATTSKPRSGLNLPSAVFASKTEEKIGLLNKAAPSSGPLLDWDPDIVETLDDDFKSYDVVITLKEGEEDGEEDVADELDLLLAEANDEDGYEYDDDEDDGDSDDEYGSEMNDDVPSLEGGFSFDGEETKSKFTSYSMSSSVIRRNNQLALLDDKFDEFFDAYDDEHLGGLDCEEIEGCQPETSLVMKQVLSKFEQEQKLERQLLEKMSEGGQKVHLEYESEEEKEVIVVDEGQNRDEKWDCESIISTYSNIYNHPKLISEAKRFTPITVDGKTGIPKDVLGKGLTASALKQLDRETRPRKDSSGSEEETKTLASRISVLSIRNRHETPEEKKARKLAIKEFKRERRIEKKANTLAFKEEKNRQEKISLNMAKNAQGVKLL